MWKFLLSTKHNLIYVIFTYNQQIWLIVIMLHLKTYISAELYNDRSEGHHKRYEAHQLVMDHQLRKLP